ncbi:MAG: glycosyltransferase family 39 protein [Candidatus Shapirobacteria bacterium]|nr:glycosyltransferase family 39 protein [Candidatus Shapirobacteria bacterium]MDD3002407.1 glycosyltransferase family 39 protein [Candidatus Shapirobacteria bacterium]MDD4383285.1 glycosyltransferase family 39 protein [Candidatus Shapirobacteria bacterium]
MQSNKIKRILISFFLIFLVIFTRFYSLDWGNGYFFNPDENNMAIAVSKMTLSDLNPHFFAYGQFPLFLAFFTAPNHDFSTIILVLRFWSAMFSSLSILFFYLIAKNIFKSKKISYIFALLLIFTPGLIQSAHFGTTESLLIFVFSANFFLSLKYYQTEKKPYFLFSIFISAIGLGSKITAIFFIMPFYLCLLLIFLKNKKIANFIFSTFIFTLLLSFLSLLFSPFNIIKFSDFKSTMNYETSVAVGTSKVFYTRQFENSTPYIFQFQKIFPYANGVFIFFFSFIGFIIFLKNKIKKEFLLILIPSIIYFIYAGQLFVKWSRFMSPLFFIGPFLCLFVFKKIQNIFLIIFLTMVLITPGVYFFQKYFSPDTRIIATNWSNSNIPNNSFILSEGGNVVDIPLFSNDLDIKVENFDFYQLDSDLTLSEKLSQNLKSADYIFVPSRRIFKNQNNDNFPLSQKYYQNLFSYNSGFKEVIIINNQKDLFLNSENAEETWSVFDNPTIRIYKRNI